MMEYEIIHNQKIRHLNVFVNEITFRSHHLHHDSEFLLVLDGDAEIMISGNELLCHQDDIVVINGLEPHEIRALNNKTTLLIIQISNHFLNTYFPQYRNILFDENRISLSADARKKLTDLMFSLALAFFKQENGYELKCVSLTADFLYSLLSIWPYAVLSEGDYDRRKKKQNRINRITSYISSNYQLPIRLTELAEQENLTVTHLSHLIRDTYGIGFQEYLNRVRFEHSFRLLPTSLTLSEIAYESGFSELKYMNQMYLKIFGKDARQVRNDPEITVSSSRKENAPLENILSSENSIRMISTKMQSSKIH